MRTLPKVLQRGVFSQFIVVAAQSANLGAQVLYVGIQLTCLPVQLSNLHKVVRFQGDFEKDTWDEVF